MNQTTMEAILTALAETIVEQHPTAGPALAERLQPALDRARRNNWPDSVEPLERLIAKARG